MDWQELLLADVDIVNHYGVKKQIPVWIEEMSELTKCLCKVLRNYDKLEGDISGKLLNDLKEEITDVTICLDQLNYAINFAEDDLIKIYEYKIKRQQERMFND